MNSGVGEADQLIYARWMQRGALYSWLLMGLSLLLYVFGWPSPLVPLQDLPQYWTLSALEMRVVSNIGWQQLLRSFFVSGRLGGEALPLLAIAALACVSIPCLLAVAVHYLRQRQWVVLFIAATETGILLFSLSGVLVSGE